MRYCCACAPRNREAKKIPAIKACAVLNRNTHACSASSTSTGSGMCLSWTRCRACCADCARCSQSGGHLVSVGYMVRCHPPYPAAPLPLTRASEKIHTSIRRCAKSGAVPVVKLSSSRSILACICMYTAVHPSPPTPEPRHAPRNYPATSLARFLFRLVLSMFLRVLTPLFVGKPVDGQPLITPEQKAMVDSRGAALERLGIEATNKQQVRGPTYMCTADR